MIRWLLASLLGLAALGTGLGLGGCRSRMLEGGDEPRARASSCVCICGSPTTTADPLCPEK
jgi:hypothetical protein